jgi:hypothetical protein
MIETLTFLSNAVNSISSLSAGLTGASGTAQPSRLALIETGWRLFLQATTVGVSEDIRQFRHVISGVCLVKSRCLLASSGSDKWAVGDYVRAMAHTGDKTQTYRIVC